MIGPRLDHKLAYAIQNTQVEIRFFHKNGEPPLQTYNEPDDPNEFYSNEVGWQDPITVTVKYQFPLLPGAGRLLGMSLRRAEATARRTRSRTTTGSTPILCRPRRPSATKARNRR